MSELGSCTDPWCGPLQEALSREPAPIEGILSNGHDPVYFRRVADTVHILPLQLDSGEDWFTAWRAGYLMAMQRQLLHLYGLTHNLRTPITGIRSRSELMIQRLGMAQDTASSDRLVQGLTKMQLAADDIETQLKVQERLFSWMLETHETGPFLLHDVVDVVIDYMQTDLFFKKDVMLQMDLADRSPVLRFPPARLAGALLFMIQSFTDDLRGEADARIFLRTAIENEHPVCELARSGPAFPVSTPTEGDEPSLPVLLSAALWIARQSHIQATLSNTAEQRTTIRMEILPKP